MFVRSLLADSRLFFPTYRLVACGLLLVAWGSAGTSSAQTPGSYRVEPESSRIEIHLFRAGLAGSLGDNHRIVLGRFSGAVKDSSAKGWEARVVGECESLEVKDENLSEASRREVQQTMLGPAQVNAKVYPTIEVQSRSFLPGPTQKSWRLLADVTLHGVTRQVEFPLIWSEEGEFLRVSGKKELLLRDFDIVPIRKFLGTIRVRNEFELVYDITLRRTPASAK